ncbi:MAG: hypothetical protein HZA34_00880 [Candidatus Pacebacteria bacterium]|nr:hypothetical protein [Candidatus Paceibacterota bacterium]
MKKLFSFLVAISVLLSGLFTPPKVSAEEIGPGYSFFYTKSKLFQVKVTRAKKVRYTFEYVRSAKGKEIQEGAQGGGKTKNGTYLKNIYAGTQSSKYFIPHNVLRGKLSVYATDVNNDLDSHIYTFVIKKNKMVITAEE